LPAAPGRKPWHRFGTAILDNALIDGSTSPKTVQASAVGDQDIS
jgi:hypothetical protein